MKPKSPKPEKKPRAKVEQPVSISSASTEEAKTDKLPLKPKHPTEKVVLLREKLQALAARGVNGEATSAQAKLERLEKRYNFSIHIRLQKDIFAGIVVAPDGTARHVLTIADFDVANATKWALEGATGAQCGFRGSDLVANASQGSIVKLEGIARVIVAAVETLWGQFRKAPGIQPADRALFIRGLLDGMLNEHSQGEALPRQICTQKLAKAGKKTVARPAGISLHPYSVAYPLGKDIRFSTDIDDVSHRLNAAIVAALPQTTP